MAIPSKFRNVDRDCHVGASPLLAMTSVFDSACLINKLQFDFCSNVTERVRKVTTPTQTGARGVSGDSPSNCNLRMLPFYSPVGRKASEKTHFTPPDSFDIIR